jgi:hypothetical protein
MPASVGDGSDDAMLLQERDEVSDVFVESAIPSTANPDVEVVALPNAPRVTLEVAAEEQLGCRA